MLRSSMPFVVVASRLRVGGREADQRRKQHPARPGDCWVQVNDAASDTKKLRADNKPKERAGDHE